MPAPAILVTLTQAKAHLNRTEPPGDPGDAEIQDKLNEAEAYVLDYCKGANGAAASWVDPLTAPGVVTAAIKLQLGRLYAQRGDDEENDDRVRKAIEHLLQHFHTPGIA